MAIEYINLKIKEIVDYADELCNELGLRYNFKWQSKYVSYMVYDYEPFCTEGFEPMLYVVGKREKLEFIKYLITQRLNKIDFLEKCLITTPVMKKGLFCK